MFNPFKLILLWLLITLPTYASNPAYEKGDYVTAFQELASLAEQGQAEAQFYLGEMYFSGKGVPKNYQEARKWFFMAAKQKHAEGEVGLGVLSAIGAGVPAYAWFNLAAELRELLVTSAQALSNEWYQDVNRIPFEMVTKPAAQPLGEKIVSQVFSLSDKLVVPVFDAIIEAIRPPLQKRVEQMFPKPKNQVIGSPIESKRSLQECLGPDNEINQAVLDCMQQE